LDPVVLARVVPTACSMRAVLRALGRPPSKRWYERVRECCREHGIDAAHLDPAAVAAALGYAAWKKQPAEVLFAAGTRRGNRNLARRLQAERAVPYACHRCGNRGEWQGAPLRLHLDHINGDRFDNRAENLRFACPNCHTQTPTWGRKKRVVRERVPAPYAARDAALARQLCWIADGAASAGSSAAPS